MQEHAHEVLTKLESAVAQLDTQLRNAPHLADQLTRIREQVQVFMDARRPSPATSEQLAALQSSVAQRDAELAALRTQLNALQESSDAHHAEADEEQLRQKYDAAAEDMARKLRDALRDRDEAHQEIVALRAEVDMLKRANASLSIEPSPTAHEPNKDGAIAVVDAEGHKRRIGEILVELGALTEQDRDEALQEQSAQPHRRLGAILLERNLVTEEIVAKVVARQLDLPFVRLTPETTDATVAQIVSAQMAKHHACVAVSVTPTDIVLAMANPFDLIGIDDVELATGRRVKPVVATQCDIMAAIGRLYQ